MRSAQSAPILASSEGSETEHLLRTTDWSRTALGPESAWPPSLRAALGICLHSRFPMFVWWGPSLINIYNDAYIPILGKRHPAAFGKPAQEFWREIWPVVGPQAEAVMDRGEATWNEKVLLVMERNGYPEDTWFTWSYSPIVDETGAIAGLFCACAEDTPRVLAERERDRLILNLDAERHRFADAFAQSPAFLAVLRGPDHVFESVNERYRQLLGNRPLLGRKVVDAIPEAAEQGYVALLDGVYQTGEPVVGTASSLLLEHPGQEPEEVFLDFAYHPMRNADGTVIGVLVHGMDVTEQTRTRARDSFLLSLDDAVRPLSDPAAIVASVARLLGNFLQLDRVAYADFDQQTDAFHVIGEFNRDGALAPPGIYQLSDLGTEITRLFQLGQAFVLDDADERAPALDGVAFYRQSVIRATISVPLHKEGRLVGALSAHQNRPRRWSERDIELVRLVANRCWESIERVRVERTLRQSEARFRQLADAMPQIVFSARPDGQIDYFNRQWYSYTGLKEGDDGTEWQQVHTPAGLAEVSRAWPEAIRTGQPYEIEYPLRRHDGEFRWHLGRALPIRDDQGRIVRWFGTNTDIHDRKRIEESLQQSEASFRGMSAALASEKVVLEMIATGSPLPDVLDSIARNAEAQSADGMLCAVMLLDPSGRHLLHGAAPSLPAGYNEAVNGVAIGPAGGSCGAAAHEQRAIYATDIATDPRWTDFRELALGHGLGACCSTPIIGAQGRVLGTVAAYYRHAHQPSPHDLELTRTATHLAGIVLDKHLVDERLHRSLEAEQDARAQAERSGRMKDEFLATLSHELRTPMSAILGWARLMQSPAIGPADMAQGVEVIERNARAQAKIIEDLLDMSAIISGKVRLNRQPMDLTEVVRTAVETARPTADAKQIDLRLLNPPAHGPIIEGDSNRLQQVMWNLINNAIKFTPPKGRIAIEVAAMDGGARVKVTDSGKGIRPEFIPYVFDRFRQADSSITRHFGGLGLGLSIVKQLVEIHGGSVAVNSAGEGLGATFVFTLPLTAAESNEASPRELPPTAATEQARQVAAGRVALSGMHVLVVDDDADARELIRRILAEHEAVVRTASSADEALAMLGEQRYDVLVSDIGMPGQDGYSLIRRVRSLEARDGGDIRAIALTAYARSQDRNDAMRAGFERHLAKPVDPLELVAAVGHRPPAESSASAG